MSKKEVVDDILKRYPHIPRSKAEAHWRKCDRFLRLMDGKYARKSAGHIFNDIKAEPLDALPTNLSGRVKSYETYSEYKYERRD